MLTLVSHWIRNLVKRYPEAFQKRIYKGIRERERDRESESVKENAEMRWMRIWKFWLNWFHRLRQQEKEQTTHISIVYSYTNSLGIRKLKRKSEVYVCARENDKKNKKKIKKETKRTVRDVQTKATDNKERTNRNNWRRFTNYTIPTSNPLRCRFQQWNWILNFENCNRTDETYCVRCRRSLSRN